MADPRSILVVKPSSLGDVVHTLPAVACLKRRWPAARVSWVINPEWAPLLQGNPDVDEVIEFPRKQFRGWRGWMGFFAWTRALRARVEPDWALDFQGLLRSAMIARRSGVKVWGLSDSREGARFLHHTVVKVPGRKEPVHAVKRSLMLVEALGCDTRGEPAWPLPEGQAPTTDLPAQFVVLHPYARGDGKSLTLAEVAAFCGALAPMPVVIVGAAGEVPGGANVVNLLGRTSLPELCWLMRRAEFVVSVDSGPAHIAAALTPRMLAIHTWSDPRQVGPYRAEAWVWKDGKVGRMGEFPEGEMVGRGDLGGWVKGRMG